MFDLFSFKLKRSFCFIILFLTILSLSFPLQSFANEEEAYPVAITETANGVVKIVTSCIDESGNIYYIHGGNGFVIATNNSEQYILTDYQLITPTEDDLNQIRRGVGLPVSSKLTTQISICFPGDITVNATMVTSSEQIGYALLKSATAINNLGYLQLGNTTDINRKQELYIVGHSGDYSLLGKDKVDAFSLEIKDYLVSEIEREPISLKLDASVSTGKTGSPLVNAEGNVVGIMSYQKDSDSLKVIPVESLITMLDTLGIPYFDTNPGNAYNVADEAIVNEFHALLSECQQDVMKNEDSYSQKTLSNYKTAINQAIELSQSENPTKDEYQACIDALNKTKKALKPKNFTYRIIQGILLICILFFLQLNIRQTVKYRRTKESINPNKKNKKTKRKQLAALIRIDTNEVIWLTKKGLRIGKNPKEVDYCIYNVPTVSRFHASIVYSNEHFYIIDNYSTNKTSINHSYIEPDKSYELFDEDTVSISDIAFTFRYLTNN